MKHYIQFTNVETGETRLLEDRQSTGMRMRRNKNYIANIRTNNTQADILFAIALYVFERDKWEAAQSPDELDAALLNIADAWEVDLENVYAEDGHKLTKDELAAPLA